MSAFLFTGWVSQFHKGFLRDSCSSVIVQGADREECVRVFEAGLTGEATGEESAPTKVERTVVAPVLDVMLTEGGAAPLDWAELNREAMESAQASEVDDFGPGYWVDANDCVPSGAVSADVESLRRGLPEEVSSGLDWGTGRMHLFLLSVLCPPKEPVDPYAEGGEEMAGEDGAVALEQRAAQFPDLAEKELAVVIRARNAVVAAWLWRRHAEGTEWEGKAIRVGGWCEVMDVGMGKGEA